MKNKNKVKSQPIPIKLYTWTLVAFWTGCIIVSLGWNLVQERKETLEVARTGARVAYEKDLIYRRWISEHGGVYAPVSEKTPSNPYLNMAERDIKTPSGRALTLINPAYMTRQVHEMGAKAYNIRAHITSLNPIRPENAPDPWETKALQAFQRGLKEVSSVERVDGMDHMHLMRPLLTEKGCLKCHAAQGYKLKDIRGGISVSIPMDPLWAIERSNRIILSLGHGFLWLFGFVGIVAGAIRFRKQVHRRMLAEEALQKSHDELEIRVKERTAKLVEANERLHREIKEHKQTTGALQTSNTLLDSLSRAQSLYIAKADPPVLFDELLNSLLSLTQSEYGFIGEVLYHPNGNPYLKTHAITNIAWNEETREFYEKNAPKGMEFNNLKTLFGMVMTTGQPVIANDPSNDSRSGGLPEGHPALDAFLGLPFYRGETMVGMVGIANRPNGYNDELIRFLQPFLHTCGNIIESFRNEQRRRQAEEQLQKSKNMLQSVVDGISDPLILLDRNLSLKMLNKAASVYYQVDPKNVLGKPCHQALKGKIGPCEECAIPSSILQGRPVRFERKGLADPDRMELVVIYPVRETDSEVESAIVRVSDITESRLMQRQLMQSEKLASLGLLISGVAHEINNPNNFITFNIPILRDYLKELIPIVDDYARGRQDYKLFEMTYPEFRKDIFRLLDNIEHGSRRINSIVSGLRDFTRKKDRIALDWVDIKQVVEKGVVIIRSKIAQMVKSLEVNVPEGLPRIHTDAEILEHVLVNLLINAAQAADKEDSWIRIGVAPGDTWRDHLMIAVSDNGCGMDEETIAKIFDPFFTTKSPGEGTGLGLSLCYNLIEGLGGRIEVESAPGEGSTFRVVLTDKEQRRMKRL